MQATVPVALGLLLSKSFVSNSYVWMNVHIHTYRSLFALELSTHVCYCHLFLFFFQVLKSAVKCRGASEAGYVESEFENNIIIIEQLKSL